MSEDHASVETLTRIAACSAVLFFVLFPYGMLYRRGRAGALTAGLAGAVIGLGASLAVFAPDFKPRGPTIATVVVVTVLGAIALPAWLAAFRTQRGERF